MESLMGQTPQMDWDSEDLVAAWEKFLEHVRFAFSGPLASKSEEEKCSYLMLFVGEKGRDIYKTWTLTADESKTLDTYYSKFEAYVKPKSNTLLARYKFQKYSQINPKYQN